MRRHQVIGSLAVLLCLAACTSSPPDETVSPSCSTDVGPIVENAAYTSDDGRLSHLPFADAPMGLAPVTDATPLPDGIPASIDGLPLVGLLEQASFVTAAYAASPDHDVRPSQLLEAGGVLLFRSDTNGDDVAAELARSRATRDRTTLVEVGPHRAALTWADPDERGVRQHHVLWTEGHHQVDVQAVRAPEDLVAAVREWTCAG